MTYLCSQKRGGSVIRSLGEDTRVHVVLVEKKRVRLFVAPPDKVEVEPGFVVAALISLPDA